MPELETGYFIPSVNEFGVCMYVYMFAYTYTYSYMCLRVYFVVGGNLNAFIGVIIFRPNKRFGYNHRVARSSRTTAATETPVTFSLPSISNTYRNTYSTYIQTYSKGGERGNTGEHISGN